MVGVGFEGRVAVGTIASATRWTLWPASPRRRAIIAMLSRPVAAIHITCHRAWFCPASLSSATTDEGRGTVFSSGRRCGRPSASAEPSRTAMGASARLVDGLTPRVCAGLGAARPTPSHARARPSLRGVPRAPRRHSWTSGGAGSRDPRTGDGVLTPYRPVPRSGNLEHDPRIRTPTPHSESRARTFPRAPAMPVA